MPLFSRAPAPLALVTCVGLVFVFYLSFSSPLTPSARLRAVLTDQTTTTTTTIDGDNTNTNTNSKEKDMTPPLTITLHPIHSTLKPHETALLSVSIKNTSPSSPLTVLTWNTPLDPRASLLGVYEVTDTTSKQQLETQTLMISRVRPPPAEDLVELAPGEEVKRQASLDGIELEAGGVYDIRASGRWQAVWPVGKEELLAERVRLEALEGAMSGGFVSESVRVSQTG